MKLSGSNIEEVITLTKEELQDTNVLSTEQLKLFLDFCNKSYRSGIRIISDNDYDHKFLKEYIRRVGESDIEVEPEPINIFGRSITLPVPMLSTQKAYDEKTLFRFLENMEKYGVNEFKMTPKLDGYAIYDDSKALYTRGNGKVGSLVTHMIKSGVTLPKKRVPDKCELVVNVKSFEEKYSKIFDNTRNMLGAIISNKVDGISIEPDDIVVVPFSSLISYTISSDMDWIDIVILSRELRARVPYDTDGVVIEAICDDDMKLIIGSTNHHFKWQMALKENMSSVDTEVLSIEPRVGHTGSITPVIHITPVAIGGVVISKVTGHNYGNIITNKIGIGTTVSIVRAGDVIPKIVDVFNDNELVEIPSECPSCGSKLKFDGTWLICAHHKCPARLSARMLAFVRKLDVTKGLGPKIIDVLSDYTSGHIGDAIRLDTDTLTKLGFGERQAENIHEQLQVILNCIVLDYILLASLHIPNLGTSKCKRLFEVTSFKDVIEGKVNWSHEKYKLADGECFCNKETIKAFNDALPVLRSIIDGSNIKITHEKENDLYAITGKLKCTRKEFKELLALRGIGLTSSIGKASQLVVGDKPTKHKIEKAKLKGIPIVYEKDFDN